MSVSFFSSRNHLFPLRLLVWLKNPIVNTQPRSQIGREESPDTEAFLPFFLILVCVQSTIQDLSVIHALYVDYPVLLSSTVGVESLMSAFLTLALALSLDTLKSFPEDLVWRNTPSPAAVFNFSEAYPPTFRDVSFNMFIYLQPIHMFVQFVPSCIVNVFKCECSSCSRAYLSEGSPKLNSSLLLCYNRR